jgi:hypothetical protein
LLSKPAYAAAQGPKRICSEISRMSAALSAGAEDKGVIGYEGVGRALTLLREALNVVDSIKAPPEIGARIQEVVDSLEELQRRAGSR